MEMGGQEVEYFLTWLAKDRSIAASTQTQALSALLFLYKHVLKIELLKLGAELGPSAQKSIVLVHPRTYQRWVLEKNLGKKPKKMGRPRTLESIRKTIIRLARETGWRYNRILGELRKLRIRCVSQSTIKNILKIERWIKSARVECLNFFIVFGKKHLDHLVSSYETFYNTYSLHQSLDNRPLTGKWPENDEPLAEGERIICHESLGGILRHYERVAA